MSDLDQKRHNLDATLQQAGYTHPDSDDNGQYSAYKAYDENNSDVYVSYGSNDPYSTYEEFDKSEPVKSKSKDECPDCATKAMYRCNCTLKEMMCKNGHMWYYKQDGTLVKGDPHENE